MSISSDASLGSLRQQAQQRADLENNPAVSTPAWNNMLTQAHKELVDKLISAYGNDYYVARRYQFVTTSSQSYPLPDGTSRFQNVAGNTAQKFYKLLGVDLQYPASPSGFVTLRRFEFIERNKYAYPNTAVNWNGYSNLRYRIEGNNLMFIPIPQTGQLVQLWYVPAQSSLQINVACNQVINTGTLSMSDTTGLAVGMNAYGNGIPSGATISTVGSTTVLITGSVTATLNSNIVNFWDDGTTFDGINGWENYVIVKSAIMAKIKQEEDISALASELEGISNRIDALSEGRDAGQAQHVSDALGAQAWGYDGYNSGWGFGGGEGGQY